MVRTLKNANRSERERFKVPRTVQKSIPIKRIYKDGIFQIGQKYSRTWEFSDINYSVASHDDQLEMFLAYCNLLNALSTDATTKITVNNKHMDADEFQSAILMQHREDGLDKYRDEYNAMLTEATNASNNIVQERYITVSVTKKNIEEARTFFTRVETDLVTYLGRLQSKLTVLRSHERLKIFHEFFNPPDTRKLSSDTFTQEYFCPSSEALFKKNLLSCIKKGHDFRDYVCPDSLEFKGDHFRFGNKFGRVLFLKEYASFIKDSMINELCALNRGLMLSIDIVPTPTDESVAELQKIIMGVESDVTRWQQRQNQNNNFSAAIPYDMEQQRAESKEMMDDITTRDQRMMFVVVTLVHVADSLEGLDADTDTLQSIGRKNLCTFSILRYQQEDGLNTALPYGHRKIHAVRTLTTESTAVLMPFHTQEILQAGGIYYGQNAISRNPIICNRRELVNSHGFTLGVSGSGKSMIGKWEFESKLLDSDEVTILIDPEDEYRPLVEAMGGEIIDIAAGSSQHINALDMAQGYGGGDSPIVAKSEFMLSLAEQVMGSGALGAKEKSLIDRCTANVCRKYARNFKGKPPTLKEFHAELLKQPEPEAKEVALAMELFTKGSLDVFSHPSNVNLDNRLLCFNLRKLSQALKTTGMTVVMDTIENIVLQNKKKGQLTNLFCDEIWLFYQQEHTANWLQSAWKRFRKYGCQCHGLTQNVEDCLRSPQARTMLANSEFLILLSQAPTDRAELAKLLNLSDTQLSFITNAEPGRGLIKVGPNLVPFVNEIDRSTELYKMMTTKPGEAS